MKKNLLFKSGIEYDIIIGCIKLFLLKTAESLKSCVADCAVEYNERQNPINQGLLDR